MPASQSALARLSRSELWARAPRSAFPEIVDVAAEALGVARVGVWLYEGDDRAVLRCAALRAEGRTTEGGARLTARGFPAYFAALEQERVIAAGDARVDPCTSELAEGYLDRVGIGAMLDAPIVVRGRSVGVVCHEHVGGPREWSESEQLTAASIADFVALVIVSDEERAARRQLGLTLAAAKVGTWAWSIAEARWSWSPELGPIVGLPWDHQPGSVEDYLRIVHPDDRAALASRLGGRPPDTGFSFTNEHRVVLPGGETRWIATRAELYRDADGRPERMVGTVMDVTDRRRLEAERLKRSRIEDVGRLASAFAHDFNNLLTVVMMGTDIASGGEAADVEAGLRFVGDAAQRAKALTGRLLSFARTRPPGRVVCDLKEVIPPVLEMLQPLFPAGVRLDASWGEGIPSVRADSSELEQVVMNLVLNARDAVGEAGSVSVAVDTCRLGPADASRGRLPGMYARVRVRDDGTGIRPEHVGRIFEPLFTTKAVGQGTGIGLATCHRIVRSAGGDICVATELGVGTEFTVLLPAAGRPADPVSPRPTGHRSGHSLRVAVHVRDPLMRELVVRVLDGGGHAAFVAHDVDEVARRRTSVGSLHAVVAQAEAGPDRLRRLQGCADAPMVVLGRPEAVPAGGHVLLKPFSGADLLVLLYKVTSGR